MTGTMPVELALFPFLQSIDLSWNLLTGSLPSEYGTMKHLLNFEMHYNLLTGSIPNSWWDFLNIHSVNWAANFLTGTLPTSIAEMRDIAGLFLYDNMFSGTLPTEIGGLDRTSKFLSNKFGSEMPLPFSNSTHIFWSPRVCFRVCSHSAESVHRFHPYGDRPPCGGRTALDASIGL
jgi:hypothetical protein